MYGTYLDLLTVSLIPGLPLFASFSTFPLSSLSLLPALASLFSVLTRAPSSRLQRTEEKKTKKKKKRIIVSCRRATYTCMRERERACIGAVNRKRSLTCNNQKRNVVSARRAERKGCAAISSFDYDKGCLS